MAARIETRRFILSIPIYQNNILAGQGEAVVELTVHWEELAAKMARKLSMNRRAQTREAGGLVTLRMVNYPVISKPAEEKPCQQPE